MIFKKGNNLWSLKLSGIIVVIFFIQMISTRFTELFLLNNSAWVQPWRFVSAIFLHSGAGHILYNLFALVVFGLALEGIINSKKFLIVFFGTGILANIFSVFFYPSSLGASGAIFGVIGTLVALRPTLFVWAFGVPMPLFLAGALWALGDIIGAVSFFAGNPISNTGNLAHLSGMVVGFVYGLILRNKFLDKSKSSVEKVDEKYLRNWEDNYMR